MLHAKRGSTRAFAFFLSRKAEYFYVIKQDTEKHSPRFVVITRPYLSPDCPLSFNIRALDKPAGLQRRNRRDRDSRRRRQQVFPVGTGICGMHTLSHHLRPATAQARTKLINVI